MTSPETRGGWVYIMVNPAWAGKVKIGKTTNPDKRLSQYQTASPYRDFEFAACVWFQDHHAAEREMLSRLKTEGEWAAIDSFYAVKILNNMKEEQEQV